MPRIIAPVSLIILVAACAGTDPETGTLVVSIRLSGIDIQREYTVTVDEMPPKAIPAGGSREVILPVGDHLIRLHGVGSNCGSSLPGVQPVSIRDGETSHLDYSVVCTPITGFVRVVTQTTGEDMDPTGYTVYTTRDGWFMIDGQGWVGTTGQVVIGPISVEDHDLLLDDVEDNCIVTGENPLRAVKVPKGQVVRDTVTVSMAITCTAKKP